MNVLLTENRVLQAIANRLPDVPANSVMVFHQPSAPTGWVRVADINTTYGLRVVASGSQGGASGGQHDPVVNDRVPQHYHAVTGTTGSESAQHEHYVSLNTSTANAAHTHAITVNAAGDHDHALNALAITGAGAIQSGGSYGTPTSGLQTELTGAHVHTASAASANAAHAHTIAGWSEGRNTGHTHSFSVTSAANANADSWRPRYMDVILCRKS